MKDFFVIDTLSTLPFEALAKLSGSAGGGADGLLASAPLLRILRLARLLKVPAPLP